MWKAYQEQYVGALRRKTIVQMIHDLGRWKKIVWTDEAAARVFELSGGFPLVARYFASYACKEGKLRSIDLERVETAADQIEKTFRKNDIGNYFKEGIYEVLRPAERDVLRAIVRSEITWTADTVPDDQAEALTELERFELGSSRRASPG